MSIDRPGHCPMTRTSDPGQSCRRRALRQPDSCSAQLRVQLTTETQGVLPAWKDVSGLFIRLHATGR